MNGLWTFASAVVVVGMLHGSASGQEVSFRAGTELVTLNVAVMSAVEGKGGDAATRYVTGLSAEQFQVFEEGVLQPLQFFSAGDLPIDLVIMLDTSASMTSRLGFVQEAAAAFVRTLRPGDRAALMGISGALRILQPFTNDVDALEAAVRSTRAGGRTPLYASIYVALTELAKDSAAAAPEATPRRKALVLLSDGADTASGFPFDELLSTVRQHGVAIYTIAPRPTQRSRDLREQLFGKSFHRLDFELKTLASETGGRAFFPVQLEELKGVYADIAQELASQYSLAYRPLVPAEDGEFRRIALRVEASGIKWRTRSGYLAETGTATSHRQR